MAGVEEYSGIGRKRHSCGTGVAVRTLVETGCLGLDSGDLTGTYPVPGIALKARDA